MNSFERRLTMCMGGKPDVSAPQVVKAPVAPAIVAPISAEPGSGSAADLERKRRQAASGRSDTILTRGLGLQDQAETGRKTLG
jgi:hypothetical protein